MKFLLPLFVGFALLGFWEWIIGFLAVPIFVLPPPSQIVYALIENFTSLMGSLIVTLSITGFAYFWALLGGVALAICETVAVRLAGRSAAGRPHARFWLVPDWPAMPCRPNLARLPSITCIECCHFSF